MVKLRTLVKEIMKVINRSSRVERAPILSFQASQEHFADNRVDTSEEVLERERDLRSSTPRKLSKSHPPITRRVGSPNPDSLRRFQFSYYNGMLLRPLSFNQKEMELYLKRRSTAVMFRRQKGNQQRRSLRLWQVIRRTHILEYIKREPWYDYALVIANKAEWWKLHGDTYWRRPDLKRHYYKISKQPATYEEICSSGELEVGGPYKTEASLFNAEL